jgi:cell division septum initiation protein DivIVA
MPNFSYSDFHNTIFKQLLKMQGKLLSQEQEIRGLENQLIHSLQDFITLGQQNLQLIQEVHDLKQAQNKGQSKPTPVRSRPIVKISPLPLTP